jgi:hypothetical protein
MKQLRIILLVTLCITLLGSQALARDVVVTRLGDPDVQIVGPETQRQDCMVGNLNAAAWAIGDWILGNEVYGFVFDPLATCDCPLGFQLEGVHMLMQFGPEDVPSTFEVFANLAEAIYDPALGCWVPGPEVCAGEVYTYTVEAEGLYDFLLPIGDSCECAFMEYMYMLSYHFPNPFPTGMAPDAISDDLPSNCTSWNDFGSGWLDLVVDFSWPGNILMWGDVACCEFPVSNDDNTWGGIKNLYR